MLPPLLLAVTLLADPRPVVLGPDVLRALLNDDRVTAAPPHSTDRREARLVWSGPQALLLESAGGEAVVRFAEQPDAAAIAAFAARAGTALGRLDWNDRSLLLRPAPGWRLDASVAGSALDVRFVRIATAPVAAPVAAERTDTVAYALAAAGADSAAGFPGRATRRIAALDRIYPDDPSVTRARADLFRAAGRHAAASDVYRALNADDPAARDSYRRGGGDASVDVRRRSGRGFAQSEASGALAVPLGDATQVSLGARFVHTTATDVAAPGGTIPQITRDLLLAEAAATVFARSTVRVETLVSANLSDPRVGVGGRLVVGPEERQLTVGGAFRLPTVATAPDTLFGGYLDRIGVGGALRLSSVLSGQADAALVRYGLRNADGVARSTLVRGGIDLLVRRRDPSVQIVYRLDAEYVASVLVRAGLPALPIVTRENHTGQAIVSSAIGAMRLTGAGGWTVDRFGGSGPTGALTLDAPFADGWRTLAAGGITSISTPGLSGTQLFLRLSLAKGLGRP